MDMPTHNIEAYRYFIGNGLLKCAERCLPVEHRSDTNIKRLAEIEIQDYARNWQLDTEPYDGIMTLLDLAAKADYALAVLSNKDETFTRQCVEHFFSSTDWAMIVGHSANVPHKPDPAGANLIAKHLGLMSQELVMVGDTSIDIATARACNMFCVGVLWGFREIAELEEAGADRIIEHPDQLLAIL